MPEALVVSNDFASLADKIGVAERDGDYDGAVALCLEALELDPLHINTRCHAAYLLTEQGKGAEAEKLVRDGLARQPESVSLGRSLAEALGAQEKYGEAIAIARNLIWPLRNDEEFRIAYAAWLMHAGNDAAAFPDLSVIWAELRTQEKAIEAEKHTDHAATLPGAPPATPDAAYVRSLFDCYAEGFDEHLGALGYCAPDVLREAVDRAIPGRTEMDIVDLGCGTGLAGLAFKALARHMTGVDFSSHMLMRARRRKIYDRLVEAEMVDALRNLPPPYDLIVAADVLIYTAELDDLFAEISRMLRPHACFAATIEKSSDESADFVLQKTRRYAHSEAYIRRLAEAHTMTIISMEPFTMRREGKEGLEALAFVAVKN